MAIGIKRLRSSTGRLYLKVQHTSLLILILTFVSYGQSNAIISFEKNEVRFGDKQNNRPDAVKVFRSFLWPDEIIDHQPIFGKVIENDVLIFKPIVPFSYNQGYTVVGPNGLVYYFILKPDKEKQTFTLTSIYPKTDQIPINTLKFNIEFSEPVSKSNIYKYIYWTDEFGQKMDRMILDLQTPLISDDGKIITLWIEPGRIKRDLGPNLELGLPFQLGKSYGLHISGEIKNKNGIALENEIIKKYTFENADRQSPNTENWKLKVPLANSDQPLIIVFDDLMDYKTVISYIKIKNQLGKDLQVNYDFTDRDLKLSLQHGDWEKGTYRVAVDYKIEDIAGNNLNRLFDEDVNDRSSKKIKPKSEVYLGFVIE